MIDITFLTEEQISGKGKLDLFKFGNNAAAMMTDFAISLGGYNSELFESGSAKPLNEREGWYWINTIPKDGNGESVYAVDEYGKFVTSGLTSFGVSARPVLKYSSISLDCYNKTRTKDGILEVEYGECPQKVVSKELNSILYNLFLSGVLPKTGKTYVINTATDKVFDEKFEPQFIDEYILEGKKYVRVPINPFVKQVLLSDGEIYKLGDTAWIEVEPIKWLVDEKNDIALSEKLLFSNIPFKFEKNYNGNFHDTDIKKFMDEHFSKDIIPSVVKKIIHEETEDDKKRRNRYGFNLKKVSEEEIIKGSIESDIPVFLHGRSSEGKSARVKQIDKDPVIIYLRNASPDSLNGKSVYNAETGEMIDIKPTWLKKLEEKCVNEPDKNHILFFDEITNALPSIQGIAFNIVLDKEVNGKWQLPENARIVAAGNDMKDSLAANQIAEPLFNRFAHVYINTTVESWLEWANENNIHPAIYAYIAYRKEAALRSKYDGEKPNADPRKWEMASKMLYKTGQPEMLRALIGEDITKEFCEFCNQRVITLEDVLNGNYTELDLEMNTSEKYATTMGLTQVKEEEFYKVREFVLKLGQEFTALFDSIWARDNEARLEIVQESRLTESQGGKSL